MRESKRRIREYQKQIPLLRAKIASATLFFMISILMMTSASLAWLTISAHPEVTGIETTIAGNGNLEIALSKPTGEKPAESAVGDSKEAIVVKNQTWGNLVNLSDSSYGLENIVLRPASLNVGSLQKSPLFAAEYAEDGRVSGLDSNFAYANYDPDTGLFAVPMATQFGVRAISSVTYTYAGGAQIFVERLDAAKNGWSFASNTYMGIVGNDDYMNTIAGIMGDFLTDKLNDQSSDYSDYVQDIYDMMTELKLCYDYADEAILYLANLQILITKGDKVDPYDDVELLFADSANWSEKGVKIDGLSQFKTDRTKLASYYKDIEELNTSVNTNGVSVDWDTELAPAVQFLVDIGTTEVDGTAVNDIGVSEAMKYITGTHVATIKKGALLNMENLLGARMDVKNLKVKASLKGISASVKANVCTAAQYAYLPDAISMIENNDDIEITGSDPVAADTYGMVVDVWVRSNAQQDYLTLEGNVVKEQIQKTDDQGNLYFTNPDGEVILGKKGSDESISYYREDGTSYTPAAGETLSITYMDIIVGYEGENRVWDDAELTEFSTTQGTGSCYIFYADSPQDQEQSLELLKAMKVVFVGEDGTLLAYADMDTEAYYAESGRVTVPLKLRNTSIKVGTDEKGEPIYAITALNKGEAKRITALIYVDGANLSNSEVLADADIQGQLNIQFGSSADMEAYKDEEVFYDEVHVTAKVEKDSFDAAETDANGNPLYTEMAFTTGVDIRVDGITPEKVTANFIRQINSTQGTRQKEITFVSTGEGTFRTDVTFTSPGTYVLRSVYLDGVEYRLDEPVTVTISGVAITGVTWNYNENTAKIMSADNAVTEELNVTFSGLTPKSVKGIWGNENNQQVTVNFKQGTTSWSGSAKFTNSGTYQFEYLLIDGEYYEVPMEMQKTLVLSLGMNAKVTISKSQWEFRNPETVGVYVTVKDNRGNEITGFEDISIQYMSQSSSLIENGLFSDLTWNEETERYEGKFNVKYAGAYEFGYLTIGDSSIHSAEATVITAVPPIPPSFHSNQTDEQMFAFGADVAMKVALNDSTAIASGNITAVLYKLDEDGNPEKDSDGNIIEILVKDSSSKNRNDLEGNDITERSFVIPTTAELKTEKYELNQMGSWQMAELRIVGAFYHGSITTAEEPMIIDVSDKGIVTTIDDEMTVKVSGGGQNMGTDFLFLDSAKATEGLIVKIQNAGGTEVDPKLIQSVKAVYVLDVDQLTYTASTTSAGYYTTDAEKATLQAQMKVQGTVTAELIPEKAEDGTTQYILDSENPLVLPMAGTYKLGRVVYNISGTNYATSVESNETYVEVPFSADTNAPVYSYGWDAPVVKVTAIDPVGDVTINTGNSISVSSGTGTNKIVNDYQCNVYLKADIEKKWYGNKLNGYEFPKVTTGISNINTFNNASLLVDGAEIDAEFAFSSGQKSSTVSVGKYAWMQRYVLGNNAKGTHVLIDGTVGNTAISYVFKLDNPIIINNPN